MSDKLPFRFRDTDSIGAAAAEDDEFFLSTCYTDIGGYSTLVDLSSPKCILLGRTGSGKSASIMNIKNTEENVIEIDPLNLSLSYISSSDIIKNLESYGVKLDIFYQLLWRHIFCVELLKYYFDMRSENDLVRFKQWLSDRLRADKARKAGVEYLERWSSKFWAETEERIREITHTLEEELKASVGVQYQALKASADANEKQSKKVVSDVVYKAQQVVNKIQIQSLHEVIQMLSDDLLADKKRQYFIVIDKLDENWVDDDIRYKLIRAMVEAIKTLRRIKSVKIVIALRTDLLLRVYQKTRDPGFQPEKYEDLNLRMEWGKEGLKELVDKRISCLIKHQYTKQNLTFYDVFPDKIGDKSSFDYIVQRTLMRPRDVIDFVNKTLSMARGRDHVSQKMVRDAEEKYSEGRARAIFFEWGADFPCLSDASIVLHNKTSKFEVSMIGQMEIESVCTRILAENSKYIDTCPLAGAANSFFNERLHYTRVRSKLLSAFYKSGMIGVKPPWRERTIFVYDGPDDIDEKDCESTTRVTIHPMLWRYLGIHRSRHVVAPYESEDN